MPSKSVVCLYADSPLFIHCKERIGEWHEHICEKVSVEIELYKNGRRADLERTVALLLEAFFDLAHSPDRPMRAMRSIAEARVRDDLSLQEILEAWRIARTSGWTFLVQVNRVVEDNECLIAMWDRYQRLADAQTRAIVDVYAVYSARSTMVSREILDAVLANPASPDLRESLRSIGITSTAIAVIASNSRKATGVLDGGKFESGNYDAFVQSLPYLGHTLPVTVHHGNLTAIIDASRFRASDFEYRRPDDSDLVIGVSRLDLGAEHLAALDRQSQIALMNCGPNRRVTQFDELTLFESATTGMRALYQDLPVRLRAIVDAPPDRVEQIRETAAALLEANMRVTEAAGALNLHSNSVYHRRNSFMNEYGIDVLNVGDVMDLMIAERAGVLSASQASP